MRAIKIQKIQKKSPLICRRVNLKRKQKKTQPGTRALYKSALSLRSSSIKTTTTTKTTTAPTPTTPSGRLTTELRKSQRHIIISTAKMVSKTAREALTKESVPILIIQ